MLPGSEREDVERGGKSKSCLLYRVYPYLFYNFNCFSYNATISSGHIDSIKYQLSYVVQALQQKKQQTYTLWSIGVHCR